MPVRVVFRCNLLPDHNDPGSASKMGRPPFGWIHSGRIKSKKKVQDQETFLKKKRFDFLQQRVDLVGDMATAVLGRNQ